jgi:hypothetical protein
MPVDCVWPVPMLFIHKQVEMWQDIATFTTISQWWASQLTLKHEMYLHLLVISLSSLGLAKTFQMTSRISLYFTSFSQKGDTPAKVLLLPHPLHHYCSHQPWREFKKCTPILRTSFLNTFFAILSTIMSNNKHFLNKASFKSIS